MLLAIQTLPGFPFALLDVMQKRLSFFKAFKMNLSLKVNNAERLIFV